VPDALALDCKRIRRLDDVVAANVHFVQLVIPPKTLDLSFEVHIAALASFWCGQVEVVLREVQFPLLQCFPTRPAKFWIVETIRIKSSWGWSQTPKEEGEERHPDKKPAPFVESGYSHDGEARRKKDGCSESLVTASLSGINPAVSQGDRIPQMGPSQPTGGFQQSTIQEDFF